MARKTSSPSSNDLLSAWPKGMGRPAARAMAGAGIHSLEDLPRFSEAELLALHGFGPKAIEVLKPALQARGLALKV